MFLGSAKKHVDIEPECELQWMENNCCLGSPKIVTSSVNKSLRNKATNARKHPY